MLFFLICYEPNIAFPCGKIHCIYQKRISTIKSFFWPIVVLESVYNKAQDQSGGESLNWNLSEEVKWNQALLIIFTG